MENRRKFLKGFSFVGVTGVTGALISSKDVIANQTVDDNDILINQPFTGSVQTTQHEKNREFVSIKDFGAISNGIDHEYNTQAIQKAFDSEALSIFIPKGNYIVDGQLTLSKPKHIFGEGADSVITNRATNVPTIKIYNPDKRVERAYLEYFTIKHIGEQSYALVIDDAPFTTLFNLIIDCDNKGFGGVLVGNEVDESVDRRSNSFLTTLQNVRIQSFTKEGIRINSAGTQYHLLDCHVISHKRNSGSRALIGNVDGIRITRGQFSAQSSVDGDESTSISWECGSQYQVGNTVDGVVFESVRQNEYAIELSSIPTPPSGLEGYWQHFKAVDCQADFGVPKVGDDDIPGFRGTMIKFDRARHCRLEFPKIKRPNRHSTVDIDATLAEWTNNSVDCSIHVDYLAAQARLVVHQDAKRAVKYVYDRVRKEDISKITVYPNLTTIIFGGVEGLPEGFQAVHNGIEWNFLLLDINQGDTQFIPTPSLMGVVKIMDNKEVSTYGSVAYDITNEEFETLASGNNFVAISGGISSNQENKTILGIDTDQLEIKSNRGNSKVTILFYPTVFI